MRGSIAAARCFITVLSSLLLLGVGFQVHAQEGSDYVEGQLIVKLRGDIQSSDLVRMKESLKASVLEKFRIVDAELWSISGTTVEEAINRYSDDPRIQYIEPNYRVQAIRAVPNDPAIAQLWGLNNTGQTGGLADADIDAPEAWNIQTGGDVLIAVIDTGVDWTHPELVDNVWANPGEIPDNGVDDDGNGYIDDVRGWDFVNRDSDPMDDNGHGTHVSGTIAAAGNNGIGIAGVCWSARIMPLKFLGSSGDGTTSDAILAIEYATMMGAKLTSNSWGGSEFSQALLDAIAASGEAGLLFIAAAGNDGTDNDISRQYPSSFELDNIIAVAATTHDDTRSAFSNFGLTSVDLGAPGSNIYSTLPGNGYGSLSGTSMATPHVAGVAALIWSQDSSLTASEVKARILNSVDPIPSLDGITVSGGRLNAFNALAEPDSVPPDPVSDLQVRSSGSNSVTLAWTASGDDGSNGRAAFYDIRYSDSPIDEGNFDAATEVSGEPRPQVAGSPETFTVTGLEFNSTYYFAVKVFDEWRNGSKVSNSPSGTTLGIPDIGVTPNALSQDLPAGGTATQTLTIRNEGEGTLSFAISIVSTGMSAKEIRSKSQKRASAATEPIYAVVLDGYGTVFADKLLWDELNSNWSMYGEEEVLIDYSTFHGIEITYEGLVASGAEVVIVSNNWLPREPHGPFSAAEAAAITRYVEEGRGLYISAGSFNNGEYPELQPHVEVLAPLVGLSPTETYFWNGNTPAPLNFEVPGHSVLLNIEEPYVIGFQSKTLVPSTGIWSPASIPTGTLVAVSENRQSALIVYKNRVYHSGLPEDLSGTESDRQFLYNAITLAAGRTSWLSVDPPQGTVPSGTNMDITVNFDATGLDTGDYAADLVITSNDPDESPFTVPVALSVNSEGQPGQLDLTWCDPQPRDTTASQDTMYVCVSDLTGQDVISYQLVVSFDERVLDAVGATSAGTLSESFGSPAVNSAVDGKITVGGFGNQPLSGSGALVGLIFSVVGNPGDATDVCLDSAMFNSGEPAANLPDPCARFEVSESSTFDIAGTVTYGITGGPVEDATMTLSGSAAESATTDGNGDYLFPGLQGGLDYTVTPSNTRDIDRNSITCFDGALAAQHAVGMISLAPEQQKAADVDEDGFIFTFDAALICRFAVGLPPFRENDQTGHWRFDPRSRSYTGLNSDQTGQDYVATLLGDVDGNWSPAASGKEISAFEGDAYLTDIVAGSGEVVSLPLMVGKGVRVHSVDVDFEYDPGVLRFIEVSRTEPGRSFQVVINPEAGRLRIGAYSAEGTNEEGALLLLKFEVIAKEGVRSDLRLTRFQVNGGLAKRAEAELIVQSSVAEIPKQFSLDQNYPNPFNPATTIRFDVPELNGRNAKVRLSIHKVTGQLVRVLVNDERPPGSHEIQWDGRTDSGEPVSSGLYFYTMVAGEYRATRKMLILK